ncbi:MAG: hypothetical protein M0R66_06840 [Candidatus Omnitrophica bacterium]|jgi:hypothetical protein|nr:hypothetical protein [Candidatus Omnitrophota bacterium]
MRPGLAEELERLEERIEATRVEIRAQIAANPTLRASFQALARRGEELLDAAVAAAAEIKKAGGVGLLAAPALHALAHKGAYFHSIGIGFSDDQAILDSMVDRLEKETK